MSNTVNTLTWRFLGQKRSAPVAGSQAARPSLCAVGVWEAGAVAVLSHSLSARERSTEGTPPWPWLSGSCTGLCPAD